MASLRPPEILTDDCAAAARPSAARLMKMMERFMVVPVRLIFLAARNWAKAGAYPARMRACDSRWCPHRGRKPAHPPPSVRDGPLWKKHEKEDARRRYGGPRFCRTRMSMVSTSP